MPTDLQFQADISTRLLVAAVFGAMIGLEREIHGHQAGVRTHMLVSLGSAIFTVLSMYGFPQVAGAGSTDPSRIAAQIVTGIGFLGAGAIVKFGTNVRGLTTAASLWVVAAVGLAAGTGAYFVAAVGTALAMISLWPVHRLVARLELSGGRAVRVRLSLKKLDSFAGVSQVLLSNRVEIMSVQSEKSKGGHFMDLELRLPVGGLDHKVVSELGQLGDVEVESITAAEEA
ncbi:MAG: MgtC/SapB family protein [Candidatus Limnocylindrales bacterium]